MAIFGEEGHVQFEGLSSFERFSALNEGTVDLLAWTSTHTMERSLHEVRKEVRCSTFHGFRESYFVDIF